MGNLNKKKHMKLFTLIALVFQANAVEVVGGITKDIACKDLVDALDGTKPTVDPDCKYTYLDDEYASCLFYKPIGSDDGEITAADWDETADKCATAFDTDGGDMKCVMAIYYGEKDGLGACSAMPTATQAELTGKSKATVDEGLIENPD